MIMGQYISKAAVVAEIESLKRTTFTNFDEGVNCAVQTLLEIIDNLEVKEVDLEKELKRLIGNVGQCDRKLAKHFFELGLKAKGE